MSEPWRDRTAVERRPIRTIQSTPPNEIVNSIFYGSSKARTSAVCAAPLRNYPTLHSAFCILHLIPFRHVGLNILNFRYTLSARGVSKGERLCRNCVLKIVFHQNNGNSSSSRKPFSMRNFKHLSTLVASFGYFPQLLAESIKKNKKFFFEILF